MTNKPGWEYYAKRSLRGRIAFTDNMKRAVLAAADRPGRRGRQLLKASAALLCVVAAVVAFNLSDFEGRFGSSDTEGVRKAASGVSLPIVYDKVPGAEPYGRDTVISLDSPVLIHGLSDRVNFIRDKADRQIDVRPVEEIEILETKRIPDYGYLYHYKLAESAERGPETNPNITYTGLTVDGYTPSGYIHDFGYGNLVESETGQTRLFGKEMLKLTMNVCWTNGSPCNWYLIKENGGLSTYMSVSADVYERDLDGDGVEEAVVVAPLSNEIYLFREENDEILWASVRQAAGADKDDRISYEPETGLFRLTPAGSDGQASVQTFRHAQGRSAFEAVAKP